MGGVMLSYGGFTESTGVRPKHLAAQSTDPTTAARFFGIALVLSTNPMSQNDAAESAVTLRQAQGDVI